MTVLMNYFSLEGLLNTLRLCFIKNNIIIIIMISLSNPYQDDDVNPTIITIIILRITIPIPRISTGNPSCPTHGFSFKPNSTSFDQFSMQKMKFNKRFDVTLSFDYISNIIHSQIILKIEDCSLLLILIPISFSSLASSLFWFQFLIVSLCIHHEGFTHLPTDIIPFGIQLLICYYSFNFGSLKSFLSLVQVWGCVIFPLYPKITVLYYFNYYGIFTNEVQLQVD